MRHKIFEKFHNHITVIIRRCKIVKTDAVCLAEGLLFVIFLFSISCSSPCWFLIPVRLNILRLGSTGGAQLYIARFKFSHSSSIACHDFVVGLTEQTYSFGWMPTGSMASNVSGND